MAKRKCNDETDELGSVKRTRVEQDRLSILSPELILRVLAFLPRFDLVKCQRLSHLFNGLASDSQLWKALYYDRFVRPRVARLPGFNIDNAPKDASSSASRRARWLDEDDLVRQGKRTDWKRQYRLRHNWAAGNCAVSEISVAEQTPVPPVLVQMHDSTIYLADLKDGLRAWNKKTEEKLVAEIALADISTDSPPTAMAVHARDPVSDITRLVIGFQDGSYRVYELSHAARAFTCLYTHSSSSNGALSAVAISWPYLATMTSNQILSLYHFKGTEGSAVQPPVLLHSLRSHTIWPPLTLSLHVMSAAVRISVAYALPTYLSGWTVGIQEMRMSTSTGELLSSRLSSAFQTSQVPAIDFRPGSSRSPNTSDPDHFDQSMFRVAQIHTKPTSLSYTHPYLLVSHPDNTLTLYLVTSTADNLSISPGYRLWGHTSCVSGAHVGGRGKAVSVSRRGDELRVWELEGGLANAAARKKLSAGDLSVKVACASTEPSDVVHSTLGAESTSTIAPQHPLYPAYDVGHSPMNVASTTKRVLRAHSLGHVDDHDTALSRGWVGFDDENIVVLKELGGRGGQSLVIYNFA